VTTKKRPGAPLPPYPTHYFVSYHMLGREPGVPRVQSPCAGPLQLVVRALPSRSPKMPSRMHGTYFFFLAASRETDFFVYFVTAELSNLHAGRVKTRDLPTEPPPIAAGIRETPPDASRAFVS
jgi:hypothetical protein